MTRAEALIHAHLVRVKAIEAKIVAMQAHDAHAKSAGKGCYTEESYLSYAEMLADLAEQIENLADDVTT